MSISSSSQNPGPPPPGPALPSTGPPGTPVVPAAISPARTPWVRDEGPVKHESIWAERWSAQGATKVTGNVDAEGIDIEGALTVGGSCGPGRCGSSGRSTSSAPSESRAVERSGDRPDAPRPSTPGNWMLLVRSSSEGRSRSSASPSSRARWASSDARALAASSGAAPCGRRASSARTVWPSRWSATRRSERSWLARSSSPARRLHRSRFRSSERSGLGSRSSASRPRRSISRAWMSRFFGPIGSHSARLPRRPRHRGGDGGRSLVARRAGIPVPTPTRHQPLAAGPPPFIFRDSVGPRRAERGKSGTIDPVADRDPATRSRLLGVEGRAGPCPGRPARRADLSVHRGSTYRERRSPRRPPGRPDPEGRPAPIPSDARLPDREPDGRLGLPRAPGRARDREAPRDPVQEGDRAVRGGPILRGVPGQHPRGRFGLGVDERPGGVLARLRPPLPHDVRPVHRERLVVAQGALRPRPPREGLLRPPLLPTVRDAPLLPRGRPRLSGDDRPVGHLAFPPELLGRLPPGIARLDHHTLDAAAAVARCWAVPRSTSARTTSMPATTPFWRRSPA